MVRCTAGTGMHMVASNILIGKLKQMDLFCIINWYKFQEMLLYHIILKSKVLDRELRTVLHD